MITMRLLRLVKVPEGMKEIFLPEVLSIMYTRYAETVGWKVEVMEVQESEAGGFSLISFMIKGDGAYGRLKYESGSHRVQRVPKTESAGRIHTSTATVLVSPEVEPDDFEINENDLEIDTCRASGSRRTTYQ